MPDSKKLPKKMPTLLALLFTFSFGSISAFYTMAVAKTLPSYIEAANKTPLAHWGVQGWGLTIALSMCAFIAWYFGSLSNQCNKIVQERWFS